MNFTLSLTESEEEFIDKEDEFNVSESEEDFIDKGGIKS